MYWTHAKAGMCTRVCFCVCTVQIRVSRGAFITKSENVKTVRVKVFIFLKIQTDRRRVRWSVRPTTVLGSHCISNVYYAPRVKPFFLPSFCVVQNHPCCIWTRRESPKCQKIRVVHRFCILFWNFRGIFKRINEFRRISIRHTRTVLVEYIQCCKIIILKFS